jgi:ferredoxin
MKDARMPKVTFLKEKQEIDVPQGANLRKEAIKAGINLYPGIHRFLNCHGFAQCGSCRVLVKKGMENLSSKGLLERFRLALSLATVGHENEMRLACQAQVLGDCAVETKPEFNWDGENFWQKPYPNK